MEEDQRNGVETGEKEKVIKNRKNKSESKKSGLRKKSKKLQEHTQPSLDEDHEDVNKSQTNLIQDLSKEVPPNERPKERRKSGKKSSLKDGARRQSKLSKRKQSKDIADPMGDDTLQQKDRSVTFEEQSLEDDYRNSLDEYSASYSPGSGNMESPKAETFPKECPLLELVPNFPTSQPEKQIYLEGRTGFSKTNHRKKTKISLASQIQPHLTKPSMTPLDLGLETQKVFRSIGIFGHGFLAGIAFWQIVLVFFLCGADMDPLDFMAVYSPLSQPLQVIFYFLTVICTISILDRYDLAQFEWRHLQKMLTFQSGGAAVLIYLVSLLLTLVATKLDDKFSLYQHNATIFEQSDQLMLETEVTNWKILNLFRCIGVIFGWIVVSIRPNTDLLYKHLKKLTNYTELSISSKNNVP